MLFATCGSFVFCFKTFLMPSGNGAKLATGGNVTVVGGSGGGSASLLGGDSNVAGAVAGEAILTGGHATGTGLFMLCFFISLDFHLLLSAHCKTNLKGERVAKSPSWGDRRPTPIAAKFVS